MLNLFSIMACLIQCYLRVKILNWPHCHRSLLSLIKPDRLFFTSIAIRKVNVSLNYCGEFSKQCTSDYNQSHKGVLKVQIHYLTFSSFVCAWHRCWKIYFLLWNDSSKSLVLIAFSASFTNYYCKYYCGSIIFKPVFNFFNCEVIGRLIIYYRWVGQ